MQISVRRRDILCGAAAALFASGPAAAIARAGSPVLTVYTEDFPHALDFAWKTARIDGPVLALSGDLVTFFKTRLADHRGVLQGYTSWSQYVVLRGLAEEQGLRLSAETQLPGAGGRALFRWVMA